MIEQLSLFDAPTPLPPLPPLPRIVRYYDDFARAYRTLDEAISKLQDLGALPPAEIVPHPTTEESAD